MNITLVDDDPIFSYIIEKFVEQFRNEKIDLTVLGNGQQALEFFTRRLGEKGKLPDILFIDINMPVMNGWELLDAMSKQNAAFVQQVPIYILTSSIAKTDREKKETYSFVLDYITKPLHRGDFFELIEKHLPGKKL